MNAAVNDAKEQGGLAGKLDPHSQATKISWPGSKPARSHLISCSKAVQLTPSPPPVQIVRGDEWRLSYGTGPTSGEMRVSRDVLKAEWAGFPKTNTRVRGGKFSSRERCERHGWRRDSFFITTTARNRFGQTHCMKLMCAHTHTSKRFHERPRDVKQKKKNISEGNKKVYCDMGMHDAQGSMSLKGQGKHSGCDGEERHGDGWRGGASGHWINTKSTLAFVGVSVLISNFGGAFVIRVNGGSHFATTACSGLDVSGTKSGCILGALVQVGNKRVGQDRSSGDLSLASRVRVLSQSDGCGDGKEGGCDGNVGNEFHSGMWFWG
jgi:hypothetical protein